MNTVILIFQIGRILLKIAPELYAAFMEIMAAVKATPGMGNIDSANVVKSTARAIMPVLDADSQHEIQEALDSYEAGAVAYREQFLNQP